MEKSDSRTPNNNDFLLRVHFEIIILLAASIIPPYASQNRFAVYRYDSSEFDLAVRFDKDVFYLRVVQKDAVSFPWSCRRAPVWI